MREKKILRFFKRLNPKELALEVHVYGYDFSWKTHIQILICSLLSIGAVGILFQLKTRYMIGIVVLMILTLPVFIINTYKRMFEQKRFSDAAVYVEQMLYSFQKNEKIIAALKETGEVFEEGRMKCAIEDAVSHIEFGVAQSEKGTLREALEIIEKEYPCKKLHVAHELFLSSEEYGGGAKNSIMLLLEDVEHWKRRSYHLQADKKRSHTDNIISIVVAIMMCAIALYTLNAMGGLFPGADRVSVFTIEIVQISSFGFIILMLLVLINSMKNMTTNWLQGGQLHKKDYLLNCYETVINYNETVEKKKKTLLWIFVLGIIGVGLYLKNKWLMIAGCFISICILGQRRIGYRMARRDVSDEIYVALPQWLMELALLLQNNNVQISIIKSIPDASLIIQMELQKLMKRLEGAPDALISYTSFCKDFDVPEAQSVMKMLHAISESGTGDSTAQINNLILCVQKMQNIADEINNKNIALRMKMIFTYPVLAATIKLLIDLTIGMVYMFQLLGGMGGL